MKNKKKKIFLLIAIAAFFWLSFCPLAFADEIIEVFDDPSGGDPGSGMGIGAGGDPGIGIGTGGGTVAPNSPAQTPSASPGTTGSSGGGQYTNQEKIPGAQPTSDFVQYLKDIINFGFAVIGILALFMLVIGAYQYLMAAGNIGKADQAKETIGSALLGLILGLSAWIILLKINPDLVSFRGLSQIGGGGSVGGPQNSTPYSGPTGRGGCEPNQGMCQVSNLSCFGSAAESASRICGYESAGGDPTRLSGVDRCRGGQPFSVGLFQINLTQHDLGMGCTSAFSGRNSSCTVINENLYRQCVARAQDPSFNIATACQLYSRRGNFGDWRNTVNKCL